MLAAREAHDRVHPMAAELAPEPVRPPDQLAHSDDADAAHPGEWARPGRDHHDRPAGLAPLWSGAARGSHPSPVALAVGRAWRSHRDRAGAGAGYAPAHDARPDLPGEDADH